MRLAAQAKGGYYPAHPDAIHEAMQRLTPPAKNCVAFDPCAGEGLAIQQIAKELGGTPVAIELSEDRAELLNAAITSNVVAPASFFGCTLSDHWASLVWCNPPFDDEIGGGARTEKRFVERAIRIVRAHGVLALVCPENVAAHYEMMQLLSQNFEADTMTMLPFPDEHRKYDEVVVFCRKLAKPEVYRDYWDLWPRICRRDPIVYELPEGRLPPRFYKTELTEEELNRAVAASPLCRLLEDPQELPIPRPPMSPGQGHRAMLLASGFVDGLVCPAGEPPHVVRGTCRKQTYCASNSTEEHEDGSETTRTVMAEKMQLVVRALDHEGTIHTLMQE